MCSRRGGREGERVGCAVDKEGGRTAGCRVGCAVDMAGRMFEGGMFT